MPDSAIRRFERDLAYFLGLPILLLVLVIGGFAKYETDRNSAKISSLRQQDYAACVSRNASKANGNAEVRVPLKQMLSYVADLAEQDRPIVAKQNPDLLPQVDEEIVKFRGYAARVKILPLDDCTKLDH